jgi:hypothetical protein
MGIRPIDSDEESRAAGTVVRAALLAGPTPTTASST